MPSSLAPDSLVSVRPPGPKRQFPGKLFLEIRRDMLGFLTKLARDYGDIAYVRAGPMDVFLINHPDFIRDVLVTHHANFVKSRALEMSKILLGEGLLTSEGQFHRRQRRLIQPAFHRQRIRAYGTAMIEYAARLRARWQERISTGATVDMHQEMMGLTVSIVGKTLFNTEVEDEVHAIEAAMNDIMPLFNRTTLPWGDLLNRLPLPSTRRFYQARDRLDAIIYRMIEEHRASGVDQGDLVSMLLLAQDEEDEGDGARMTDRQVRDEALTIFLAGHETTANALTYTWYLLAQHPEVEAKLHAEIDAVLAGRLPTVDDLPQLKYTEMVFAESMRLYPPAWALGRRALHDYQIGPYSIPAGSVVIMSQWVMHRDERYFPDPLRFDPERWQPEIKETRPKFAYFPFGGGPRVCIGEAFAWMEGVLLIATLAQQWRMRLAPGFRLKLQPLITLRPRHGVKMTLERRQTD